MLKCSSLTDCKSASYLPYWIAGFKPQNLLSSNCSRIVADKHQEQRYIKAHIPVRSLAKVPYRSVEQKTSNKYPLLVLISDAYHGWRGDETVYTPGRQRGRRPQYSTSA